MATSFINLPTVAANGSGVAVDTSTLAAGKTLVYGGNGGIFEPFVTIEISNEAAPTSWAPIYTFQFPDQVTFYVAARWMRATVANYRGGGAPEMDVGADLDIQTNATLVAPAGNASGASVATSSLGNFKSVHVGDTFRGTLNVEISENGATDWATVMSFTAPGVQSASFTADFMRVTRVGVPGVDPGLPTIDIAAEATAGGGGAGLMVQDEGVDIGPGPFSTINFVGSGVTATDVAGVARVEINGGPFGLPEQWCANDIAALQEDVTVAAQVSTNFDDVKMMRAGSIVGVTTRLTEPVTDGSLTVFVSLNGVATAFLLVHTSILNPSGGIATQASGVLAYVAGDLIGVHLTTNAGFLPVTTDLEVWIEVTETL